MENILSECQRYSIMYQISLKLLLFDSRFEPLLFFFFFFLLHLFFLVSHMPPWLRETFLDLTIRVCYSHCYCSEWSFPCRKNLCRWFPKKVTVLRSCLHSPSTSEDVRCRRSMRWRSTVRRLCRSTVKFNRLWIVLEFNQLKTYSSCGSFATFLVLDWFSSFFNRFFISLKRSWNSLRLSLSCSIFVKLDSVLRKYLSSLFGISNMTPKDALLSALCHTCICRFLSSSFLLSFKFNFAANDPCPGSRSFQSLGHSSPIFCCEDLDIFRSLALFCLEWSIASQLSFWTFQSLFPVIFRYIYLDLWTVIVANWK